MTTNTAEVLPCLCGEKSYELSYATNPLLNNIDKGGIVSCLSCGLKRTTPRPLVQVTNEDHLYQDENYFAGARDDLEFWLGMQIPIIRHIKKYKKKGTWLDIGTGMGFLVKVAKDFGYNAEGIDLNEPVIKEGRELLKIPIRVSSLEEVMDHSYDIITLNHVVEHVKNPEDFIKLALKKLSPDGVLVIGVPNINSGIARLLRFINKLPIKKGSSWPWQGYQLEQHLWHFTPETFSFIVPKEAEVLEILKNENMFHGFLSVNKIRYKIIRFFLPIMRLIYGGDNMRVVLKKR